MPEGSPGECVCLQISVPVSCLLGVVPPGTRALWRLKGQGLSGLSCSARKWGANLGNAETQRPESWAGSSLGGWQGRDSHQVSHQTALEPRVFLCCVAQVSECVFLVFTWEGMYEPMGTRGPESGLAGKPRWVAVPAFLPSPSICCH